MVFFPASHSFPYVKKRILVVYHKESELTPIEVSIDEMQNKVADLEEVISQSPPDLKKIQLKLQGSVSVQVRFQTGPAYQGYVHLETCYGHFTMFSFVLMIRSLRCTLSRFVP